MLVADPDRVPPLIGLRRVRLEALHVVLHAVETKQPGDRNHDCLLIDQQVHRIGGRSLRDAPENSGGLAWGSCGVKTSNTLARR